MSFEDLLLNRVVIEHRGSDLSTSGEDLESFTDGATIDASVQEQAPSVFAQPDADGPVQITAVIFTAWRTDIAHLDRLRQVDVTPPRTYSVELPRDPAGRHHHLEIDAKRLATVAP